MKKNDSYTRGLNAAFRAIARRDCSVSEIRELLKRKEVEQESIEEIIQALERDNYLDDSRFTASVVKSRKRYKLDGPMKIRQFLLNKGIREEMINAFLRENYEEEDEIQAMRELLGRKRVPARKNFLQRKQYLYNYLVGKGFSSYKALQAIDEYLKKGYAAE